MLKALKEIADTETLGEQVEREAEKNNLEKVQEIYIKNLRILEKVLAPPFPDFCRLQQNIWKCFWLRFGNKVMVGGNRRPAQQTEDNFLD